MNMPDWVNPIKQELINMGRQLSDALAVMSWRRFILLVFLGKIFLSILDDWAVFSLLNHLAPFFILFCIVLKIQARSRQKAVEGRDLALISAHQAQSKLQALDAKLDAHFLFNAMATVEFLIPVDSARALTLQKALSIYLRSGLSEPSMSSLSSQSKACEAYLIIQQTRMGERLDYHVQWSTAHAAMPNRIALALLEKAVSQNIEPTIEGGTILLSSRQEEERFIWQMQCPISGVSPQSFSDLQQQWVTLAPQGQWHVTEDQGQFTFELSWVPQQTSQASVSLQKT